MPGGRPTKYTSDMVERIDDYLAKITAIAHDVPFIEDVSLMFGIDEDTVTEWAKEKPEFSGAIKRLKDLQKKRLQSLGLNSRVNTTMAIFLLKANHGFVDVQRQEITGKNGDPIETTATLTYMPKQLPNDYFAPESTEADQ